MAVLDPNNLNPAMKITLVTGADGLAALRSFLSTADTICVDVETNVTDDFTNRYIRTIQVGNKDAQFVIDLLAFAGSVDALMTMGEFTAPEWATGVCEALSPALCSDSVLKVGYNLQFDYEALAWCLGLRMWHLYDAFLVEKALYAGAVNFFEPGFWSLADALRRYLNLEVDKTLQTSFGLADELTSEQILYAALDVRLPLALRQVQGVLVDNSGLLKTVEIENDAIPAFGDMHLHGFKLDQDLWLTRVNDVKTEHAANIAAMDSHFIPVVGRKGLLNNVNVDELEALWRNETDKARRAERRRDYLAARKRVREAAEKFTTCEGEAEINYASNPQLRSALLASGIPEKDLPNTNDRTLSTLKSLPIVAAVIAYRRTGKLLSTYGENFPAKYINPVTGRVHSEIDQYGAETGRTTSAKPNIQNIPKSSKWRSCFVAAHGNLLITSDYNGCELRILAEASGEPAWVDAFNKGWDVHSVGAEILFGEEWKAGAEEGCAYYAAHAKCSCKAHKILRDHVKAINFGIAYGMEAGKLADSLGITKKAAKELLERYRKAFPCVTKYLAGLGLRAKMRLEARTLAGRRRLFNKPTWERAKELARGWFQESGNKTTLQALESRAYNMLYSSIEREGKNTPIQGTNADMVKLAVGCGAGYLWHELRKYGAMLVNIVHDELVVECPEEYAETVQKIVGDCMVRAGVEFIKSIPVTYEFAIAKEWTK